MFNNIYIYFYLMLLLGVIVFGLVLALLIGAYWLPNRNFQDPVIAYWCRLVLWVLGVEVELSQSNNTGALTTTALWVSNHVSWLDIVVLRANYPVSFLAKAEIAKWPLVGGLARAAGSIFIKRGSKDSAQKVFEMSQHLNNNRSALFFPEGTTSNGLQLLSFYPKLFQTAIVANKNVQPVCLTYLTSKGEPHLSAPFIGDDNFVSHIRRLILGPKVYVRVALLNSISSLNKSAGQICQESYSSINAALNTPKW